MNSPLLGAANMTTMSAPKTITILDDEKKAIVVAVIEGDKRADVTYRHPLGHLASASWRLLFIREALDLCDTKTFEEVCYIVGMPDEYDWSFVRDADSDALNAASALLYRKVGAAMNKLGLTSVAMRAGG